ncbi:MAG TPA: hypothetical protein VL242_27075, partial [Sorangium sp.]|nr:hypothetical protein [Sorangium sp.]
RVAFGAPRRARDRSVRGVRRDRRRIAIFAGPLVHQASNGVWLTDHKSPALRVGLARPGARPASGKAPEAWKFITQF